ncbi:MAG: type II toxin-antitoxin system RelE/ParE family toxin [Methylomonas sp.]|nr:type II toxin-antitoxin system RelE/ParE family toxin [Methylomonas sp.]
MNKRIIAFSPRAKQRLGEIADYLYSQNLSKAFVINYLEQFEAWLNVLLGQFPEPGVLLPEYGDEIRKVVYKKYSFVYRIKSDRIEVLTIFRENLP